MRKEKMSLIFLTTIIAASGCLPKVQLPAVVEPLDSPAWQRCAEVQDEGKDPNAPKMAEELTRNTKTMICQSVVLATQGKTEEALEILNEVAVLDKADHRPYYLSGRILAAAERYDEAMTAFERSAKRFPSMEPPTERIGRRIMDQDGAEESLDFLLKAKNRKLCPYGCKGLIAEIYRKQKESEKAIAIYNEMLNDQPGEPAAFVGLAGLYNAAADYPKEVAMLERATHAVQFASLGESQKADVFYRLTFSRYNAKAYPQAAGAIADALALEDDHADWLVLAGWIEMKRNRPKDAERFFAKARLKDPRFAAAHVGIGDAKAAQDKLHEAIGAYQRARDLDPTSAQYILKLAYANARIGDLETAGRLVDEAVRLDGEHLPEALLSKVTKLLEQSPPEEQ